MNSEEQKLYEQIRKHMDRAYVPYSHFKVGAGLITESGQVVLGVNIENSSYPEGLCAERVTLFSYVNQGLINDPIKMLMVSGNTPGPISPCGACRQVMTEFMQHDTPVLLTNEQGDVKRTTLEGILPYYFTEQDLHDGQNK
ncbi:MAG: cytidine deaminase [Lactobacillus sp.]|jgi:cytidine deaminase|nr:cytidine deaminase [Lactobacillus sp.]MCH3990181.1 cytidine deaminase [Lactobacillus sp.]MCH4069105.1 cytidine deaminase [Lactobacillus sp.]MCI1303908.1 cytidine deaminase [Lactobacillus sp.]MCI1329583.1 cytidine deaminase [Lactobacillus sp.]